MRVDTSRGRRAAATQGELPGMNGIRALACLTVFLANAHHTIGLEVSGHAGPLDLTYFAESGIGVVALIVLSGALLSLPFWRALHAGTHVSVASFWLRRVARLVPAYYVALVGIAVLGGATISGFDLAVHMLFVNNLREGAFYTISPQFWTIGMFVQFYVLLPLVFFVLRKTRVTGTRSVLTVGVVLVASYGLHWWIMTEGWRWIGFSGLRPGGNVLRRTTLAHFPHFLCGVIAGYVMWRTSARARTGGWAWEATCWIAAVAVVLLTSVPAADTLEVPYGRYLFPWLPVSMAVAVAAVPWTIVARRLLDAAPLRWLGVISYGVYVYHVGCMVLVERLLPVGRNSPTVVKAQFLLLGLTLTVVVSVVSYIAIERPIAALARRFTRKPETPRPSVGSPDPASLGQAP